MIAAKLIGLARYAIELTGIGVTGITISELNVIDLGIKILIGLATLSLIIIKGLRDFRKDKTPPSF